MPTAYVPALVVVDVANVMGSRPDGWWRDRAGAAARLGGEIAALAARGIDPDGSGDPDGSDPDGSDPDGSEPGGDRVFPAYLIVLEGQARSAAPVIEQSVRAALPGDSSRVTIATAARSGDDAIVDAVAALDGSCLVVTADRELRRRCEALGASVSGPGWLLRLL